MFLTFLNIKSHIVSVKFFTKKPYLTFIKMINHSNLKMEKIYESRQKLDQFSQNHCKNHVPLRKNCLFIGWFEESVNELNSIPVFSLSLDQYHRFLLHIFTFLAPHASVDSANSKLK